jgi:cholesterol transport system auxiliary component
MKNTMLKPFLFRPQTANTMLSTLAAILVATLSACATPPSLQLFDFGTPTAIRQLAPEDQLSLATLKINLSEIRVASHLEGNAMWYRLSYDTPQELRPYAQNRWSVPPAQLLAQSIKGQLALRGAAVLNSNDGVKDLPILKIELEEFSQIFSNTTQSNVNINFRASLVRNNVFIAQRSFGAIQAVEVAEANAKGGARAMPEATNQAINALAVWLRNELILPAKH